MGRQINFFLHQDDQADFDRLLKTFGDIILLPYYHYDNEVSIIDDTLIRDKVREGRRVYLIRRSDFKDIPLTHIEDNKIEIGRIYFQPDFVDAREMRMVKKSDDFVKWADDIIKTVRRKLRKCKYSMGSYSYTAYLGDKAMNWKNLNGAEITSAGDELKSNIAN